MCIDGFVSCVTLRPCWLDDVLDSRIWNALMALAHCVLTNRTLWRHLFLHSKRPGAESTIQSQSKQALIDANNMTLHKSQRLTNNIIASLPRWRRLLIRSVSYRWFGRRNRQRQATSTCLTRWADASLWCGMVWRWRFTQTIHRVQFRSFVSRFYDRRHWLLTRICRAKWMVISMYRVIMGA